MDFRCLIPQNRGIKKAGLPFSSGTRLFVARIRFFLHDVESGFDGSRILRLSDTPLYEIDGGPAEQVDVIRVRTLPNGADEILCR